MSNFYFHDYETFGTSPFHDKPSQFAGIRTDLELNPIGDPDSFYCRPPEDYLPHPAACLITGITPQQALAEGLAEHEFAANVHEILSMPGTCALGYNSVRFDDEFTRNLLYRNFYDPYAREWQHGNSRWDLIDIVRLCYALRPQGINWPRHDTGKPSFKLEDLSEANGLTHTRAHDALSDVEATIALARLIKKNQPKLFQYCFEKRGKRAVSPMINPAGGQPVIHVSSRFPAERGCLAIVLPLCAHPDNPNGVIVYDLHSDPQPLLDLSAEDIHDLVFTPTEDLPEDMERIPLKTIHINKCPVIAPLGVLKNADLKRINLDYEQCMQHWELIRQSDPVAQKVREVFGTEKQYPERDAEASIYAGSFLNQADRQRLQEVRVSEPLELATISEQFEDPRYRELVFRYRARHYPDSLDSAEQQSWQSQCGERLQSITEDGLPLWQQRLAEIEQLRSTADTAQQQTLDQLQAYISQVCDRFGLTPVA